MMITGQNNTSAVKILCDGTIRAAILILRDRGIDTSKIDAGKLSADLKAILHTNIESIMKDWEDAVNANLSEGWLREMMNLQCNEMALKALTAGGWF